MKIMSFAIAAALITLPLVTLPLGAQKKPEPVKSVRIYAFDLGSLTMNNPAMFNFTKEELGGDTMKFVCVGYLIVHPKGTLMWDTGVIPDAQVQPGTKQGISTVTKTLTAQLAEIGYKPSEITYLGLSHLHSDHTANANAFAGSTWLVHQTERDAMFAPPPADKSKAKGPMQPTHYNLLKDAKTKILTDKDYDVFGDGKVVIMYTPGHTPGHQVVLVNLAKTGPVLLAGDLYHLPQEVTMHRFPSFEFDKEQSAKSREKVDAVLKKTKGQMWIEHDPPTFEKIKHAPAYIE